MSLIAKLADNKSNTSLSHKMRSKRFDLFLSLIRDLPRPLSILDIGGTLAFWESMDFKEEDVSVTLLNLVSEPVNKPGFRSMPGDATDMKQFADQSFDVVFSNSVIEHLFNRESQFKMSREIQRVGKYYFIQTPNYWFPVEPHWLFPFFQYLPFGTRVWLTRHFSLGHIKKIRNHADAEKQVKEIQLLTEREFSALFPSAKIYREKMFGLNKSFVAYRFQQD